MRLNGKRVLVTGGASGIGAAIVERFRAEGARVVVGDLRGGDVELDVRSAAATDAAVAFAVERLGGLDSVVCNAGRPAPGTALDTPEDAWDDTLAINAKSIYLMARSAWPHLEASKGSILATASICSTTATQNQIAYCASKAAAMMTIKCLALDGAKVGIRAACVLPGFTRTPMLEAWADGQPDPAAARAGAASIHPLGRLGEPDDIASAFVYLASDDARWVTGAAIAVDGGLTTGLWGG
jgi:NAD(P)-dependent dehydrogenase (short-subunit alcohol dehydrogenase family)